VRLSKSWIIASKDFKTFRKKKNIIYALVVVPLMVAVIIPGILTFAGNRSGSNRLAPAELTILLPAFAFFYIMIAAYLPTPIASYTLVGEKVEKSLEPLLATPVSDGEILLGKSVAAFLPTMLAVYAGASIFMTLVDWGTYNSIGYLYYPNWDVGVLLLILAPLAALLSVEFDVIASARFTDVRAASSVGGVMVVPFMAIYIAGEIGAITLDATVLLIISGVFLLLDVGLFFVSTHTFQREEILTKWK